VGHGAGVVPRGHERGADGVRARRDADITTTDMHDDITNTRPTTQPYVKDYRTQHYCSE